jgi:hypothetical protein
LTIWNLRALLRRNPASKSGHFAKAQREAKPEKQTELI